MVQFHLSDKPLAREQAELYGIFCDTTFTFDNHLQQLADVFYKPLQHVIEQRDFKGAAGSSLVVTGEHHGKPVYIILVGLGAVTRSQADRLEQARRAAGQVIRAAEQLKVKNIALAMPDAHWFAASDFDLTKEMVITMIMASYHFDQFITDSSRKLNSEYEVTLCAPALLHETMQIGIEHGLRIGFAVNQARHWCDLPPVNLTPTALADQAARIGDAHNLKTTIFNEQQIVEMGMGGLHAVSKGSAEECRFVILEYTTEHPNAPTVALVGKGITFDSGGLSIKPADRMDEMKDDMAGAAAVISTMEAIAHLKPRVNVIGIAPISENLPSGTATRPGDIITFYNGKTAEVKNTDAEGRLILADAMSYAIKHYNLDAIIDIATLTGSCAYALGPFFCGLMSQHEELAERIVGASKRSGDRVWPLPFHDDYKKAVQSSVADLCNIGDSKYRAGSITAGFFLQNFVGNVPWVHLDVAGTSFNVPDMSYYRPGATGFGVRLFVDMLLYWN